MSGSSCSISPVMVLLRDNSGMTSACGGHNAPSRARVHHGQPASAFARGRLPSPLEFSVTIESKRRCDRWRAARDSSAAPLGATMVAMAQAACGAYQQL